jgi:hypothetical protein
MRAASVRRNCRHERTWERRSCMPGAVVVSGSRSRLPLIGFPLGKMCETAKLEEDTYEMGV